MSTLLVTGASGQFGRLVLGYLTDTLGVPANRIIATTRTPDSLADWAAKGVSVRAADFDDPATLPAAFAGADRLLLISTDSIDRPGRRVEQHRAAIAAAKAAGVTHLIYTSCPEPETAPVMVAPDHAATEAALRESGLPGWTLLRNHWYFENLLMTLPSALATGHWYSAAGDGRNAHVARADLAHGAAAALASDFSGTRTLTLSGETAYSTADIAALVSQTVDKPIVVIPVPADGLVQGMIAAKLPEPLARFLASFDVNTAEGFVGTVTGDLRALTGTAPQPFESWLTENKAVLANLGR